MSVRRILRMGHPDLRRVCDPVADSDSGSPGLQALVDNLVDTMHASEGLGLAAAQIGDTRRVAVIEIQPGNTRYPDAVPTGRLVLVNPVVTVLDPTLQRYWEGCLSVPGLRGEVARPRHIAVDYHEPDGTPRHLEPEGFLATVFQHEIDHLDGTLFIDRVTDTTRLAFLDEYREFHAEA
ncbi:peptide deformylase [Thioalkalivibrio sp. ALE21]|uniref:peptide deformylase n=1 Tax=Thioalkalivibrio sp. ALE21 TaxID=1158175 RepID=UPI000D96D32D|nr:peptide deformylase [Thioalkalivibrio sp. ALE21]PYG03667.1 peptide deformylase [Thioalkalivibrio sp. ALE21]